VQFVEELKGRGMRHRYMSLDDMGHALDVNLQRGERSGMGTLSWSNEFRMFRSWVNESD
jgi:hypothetical protein